MGAESRSPQTRQVPSGRTSVVWCGIRESFLIRTISLGTSSIQRPSVSRSSSIVRFMSQSYHGRLYRLKPVPPLLLNHGAIAAPHFAPTAVETLAIALLEAAVGISGCQLFVDFDAPAGGVEVDEKLAARYPYGSFEQGDRQRLNGGWGEVRRRDGTVIKQ